MLPEQPLPYLMALMHTEVIRLCPGALEHHGSPMHTLPAAPTATDRARIYQQHQAPGQHSPALCPHSVLPPLVRRPNPAGGLPSLNPAWARWDEVQLRPHSRGDCSCPAPVLPMALSGVGARATAPGCSGDAQGMLTGLAARL